MQPNPDYADVDALPSDPQWGMLKPWHPNAQTDMDWVTGLSFQEATAM
jgi:hypothetical protein